MAHIFYNTSDVSLSTKLDILVDAQEYCYDWWVDMLDCSVSPTRQLIEMEFGDILEEFDNQSHFSVILRNDQTDSYGEIGFRSTFLISCVCFAPLFLGDLVTF